MAPDPKDGFVGNGRGADAWARTYDVLGHVAGLILAIMAGAVFLQVILRFLGQTGIDGLEDSNDASPGTRATWAFKSLATP